MQEECTQRSGETHEYKLPTLDDVLPKLKNAKIFSKLDIKEAYWHIRLD